MGSYAVVPDDDSGDGESADESDENRPGLGDLLAGRLSEVEVDSVEAVREIRERE